jgi:two-component system OmpR family response regulator
MSQDLSMGVARAVRGCRHGHAAPRILVIEDEALIAAVVVETLVDEGYEVQSTDDGHAALTFARRWSPCLVLLDILMPAMDGRAVLRGLRRLEATAETPVALVSGAGGPMLSDVSMDVAAVILKPFRLELLVDLVTRLAI